MSFSERFIRRRVGTTLLAIGLVGIGLACYFQLPVAPLPQVEFPTISVKAQLPGASADTMATSVATPLERYLSNIPGVAQMTSASSLGTTNVVLQFDLARSIDSAAQDVQTAINAAAGTLPKNMPSPPTYNKVNPADGTILSLAMTSDTLPLTELDRLTEDFVAQQVSQLNGVGLVDYHGQLRPSVRLRLDPDKLAGLGLTLEDVRQAVAAATVNSPKGSLNGPNQSVMLDATDQVISADAYAPLVVTYRNGLPIRLGDLGTIREAPEDVRQAAWLQGKPAIIIDVHKQPGANVVDTIQAIKDSIPKISASLPPAVTLQLVGDRTQTIVAAVDDVQVTMLITVALVVMVIFSFLRNGWATLIPSLTIPLSVITTFGVMYLIGYSLNNLSLMGLTIAVGFVVDDAIVVIENVVRHLEMGKGRVQAAIEGTAEVASTIVSMTISLIAVFIPILMMGGIVGRLFREFGVTVAVAIAVSGFVSLTLTPMLCGWLLKHEHEAKHGRLYQWSERMFEHASGFYGRTLDVVLRHTVLMLMLCLVTIAATGWLFINTPKGFFPQQDTGVINVLAQASPDISFNAMSDRIQAAAKIVQADPDVANVYEWIGPNPTVSQGHMLINLKPQGERAATADQIVARLKKKVDGVEGIRLGMQVFQNITIGGRQTAAQYQYTLQSSDIATLNQWAGMMQTKMAALPMLLDVSSDRQASARSAVLHIDRDTASRLGVSVQAIDDTLYDAFGQRQVATLFTQLNQYKVVQEVDPSFQQTTAGLSHLFVRSSTNGQLVPLNLLVKIENTVAPVTINHQGLFPSITLSFNLAPGAALGDAVTAIQDAALSAGMPGNITTSFQGSAQAFQSSLKSQPWLILTALIAVYIVLGVLYESPIHPLTVISTLPSAGLGAILALRLTGNDLSIIGIIGIILLIGIVKKNAIMMIDFALVAEREHGKSSLEAIREGCLLRFRPIMMTTLAAMLGAVPLAIGYGTGAELRVPLGIAIVGGLIISQMLTLYTTPVIYVWFDKLVQRGKHRKQRLLPEHSYGN